MASVSLAEARAYLGIDGADHDVYLAGMRRESERRVRRLTIIGDSLNEDGDDFAYLYPDELQPAQLILIKWMFDRRENPDDAKSPPPLYGMIDGYERGVGNPNEKDLRVYVPSEPIAPPPEPFFYLGWTQIFGVGFDVSVADALAHVITQDDFDHAARADGNGPLTYPPAHFVAGHALGWGFYWIAVEDGRGEPPGGVSLNGTGQGTGLVQNDTMGFTDTATGLDLEFWMWTASQNIGIVGGGGFALTLLGYPA